MIKKGFILCFLVLLCLPLQAQKKEVVVFHKTEGFWHESIPAGFQAIQDLGEKNDFTVTETKDAKDLIQNLKEYDLVVFLSTSGDIFNEDQEKAFEDYINSGGNFFGIHAAADTEHDWKWYGKLVGAYFVDHPEIQEAEIDVKMPKHPSVAHLPEKWVRTDEWYNYKNLNEEMQVLLTLDESSYRGGKNIDFHPIAWYRDLEGGGKSIYTGGGHTIQSYVEPEFVEHLLQCILFGLGEEK